jgi:branched-chain amino acid transport system substrate-binding protein
LQAQTSKSQIIGLANTGQDAINSIKQAAEFGILKKQKMAALLIFLTDVKGIGLDTAQGLLTTTGFYWNRTPETRVWSERFFKLHGAMPTMVQASVYSAISNYLKAVTMAGTDDSAAVRAELGEMTIDDFFTKDGRVLPNGLMSHDMYLVEVKKPSESKGPWDLLKVIRTIPANQAWIPLSESKCPLLRKDHTAG